VMYFAVHCLSSSNAVYQKYLKQAKALSTFAKQIKIIMKKNKITLLFLLIALCMNIQNASAQNKSKKVITKKQISKSPNISGAYLGSIKYPGFKLGLELPQFAKEKTKTKISGNTKVNLKERFLAANLSMYHHPTYHTNYMLTAEWLLRNTRKNGWFTEFAPGLGISRTILAGTTYKQNANGDFDKVTLAGNTYGFVSILGGFGYDFNVKKQKPFKLYAKGGLLIFGPYNSFILPRPTVELGIITSISSLKKKI
jgi:hypothetical protein